MATPSIVNKCLAIIIGDPVMLLLYDHISIVLISLPCFFIIDIIA